MRICCSLCGFFGQLPGAGQEKISYTSNPNDQAFDANDRRCGLRASSLRLFNQSKEESMMGKTYVVGVGMTAFGRHPERSTYDMVNEALDLSLTDAGVDQSSIGAVYYSNATGGYLQGQSMVPGPIPMRRYGIAGLPVSSVENA